MVVNKIDLLSYLDFKLECFYINLRDVHRFQEAQGALGYALWEAVKARLLNPHEPNR